MAVVSGGADGRERRALEMLHGGSPVVATSTPGEFVVASQSGRGLYRVSGIGVPDGFESCTCADFEERLAPCKHILAARHWLVAAEKPLEEKAPLPPIPPVRNRPINWSVYDKAQTEEFHLVHVLLRELTASLPEPAPNPKGGRPAVPLREQAFSAIQKCYAGFSFRRSQGLRAEATAKGQLSRTPYWAVGSRFLCRPDVTADLHRLLAQSALPLMAVERACAVDSTGMRTTRFNYYRKEKYDPQRQNIWLKMHALVGVETHVIPVIEVTEGSGADSPMFPVLLEKATKAGFHFEEVYADKAYNGRANYTASAELGIEPFIPFKSNATGKSLGSSAYHRMYLFYRYHREKFDAHYGQRAQVEATFGALKAKLGEGVASRTISSQINEILCAAIAYNLTILVRQMFERGLLPDFLQVDRKGLAIASGRAGSTVSETPVPVSKPASAVSKPPTLGEV